MNDAVVVGYDQSQSGDHLLAEAARAAERRNAPLVVLNVYPRPTPSGAVLPVPATRNWPPTDLAESANKLVGRGVDLVRSRFPDLRVDGRVATGRAWEALSAASLDAALVVVGSHDAGGLTGPLLGSVTQRVLSDSACPVLVVPTGRRTEGGPVIAAVDIDEPCDEVLDFAFAEAGRRQTALEVVHVWEEPWNLIYVRHTEGLGKDVALIEDHLRLRLDELLHDARVRYPGIDPVERIKAGSPGRTLITMARYAGLIVVGARRWGGGTRHRQRVGPVPNTLLQRSECPVAVVPCGPAPH